VLRIASSGVLVAGLNSTLTCHISIISGLVEGTLFKATWSDANGVTLQMDSSPAIDTNKTVALDFTPLLLSYGGRYTCSASVTIPEISVVRTTSVPFDITIPSKCTEVAIYCGIRLIIFFFLFQCLLQHLVYKWLSLHLTSQGC